MNASINVCVCVCMHAHPINIRTPGLVIIDPGCYLIINRLEFSICTRERSKIHDGKTV